MGDRDGIGQWLKGRRETLGLTLRDVERITEGRVSNAYLSQVETGQIDNLSAVKLHQLAAAYALDFAEALERAGSGNTPRAPDLCPTCGRALP